MLFLLVFFNVVIQLKNLVNRGAQLKQSQAIESASCGKYFTYCVKTKFVNIVFFSAEINDLILIASMRAQLRFAAAYFVPIFVRILKNKTYFL